MGANIFGQGGSGSGGSGGSNASVGATGVTAPTSATEIGIIVSGNLQAVSAANPLPISGSITASNAAVGATGSAVPASASYDGINVAGTMRGQTGVNPSGSIYASQIDIASVLGATLSKTNPVFAAITDGTNVITAAISAYGTAPTGTEVMGVNAYITGSKTFMTGTTPGTAPAQTEIVGLIYNTSAPAPTTGQTLPLQGDSSGNLLVNVKTGANPASGATGSAVPASGSYTAYNSGGNLTGVSTSNPLPVGPVVSGTLTDRSGTVTTGTTSQQIAAVNANRKYLFIQNPSSQTESLFVNFTAAATLASNSIELLPGGTLLMTIASYVSTEAVNVNATTTAHPFVSKEG